MPSLILEPRVERLEDMMAELTRNVDRVSRNVDRLTEEMQESRARSEQEMREFKQEMQEFKQEMQESRARSEREMREFKQEMQEFKQEMQESRARSEQEMQEFKQEMQESRARSEREMQEFKQEMQESHARSEREMREFKQESRRFHQRMNELAVSQGRLTESLVTPSLPAILERVVGTNEPAKVIGAHQRRYLEGGKREQEYDALALCGDYLLINETRTHLRSDHILPFLTVLREARAFIPELADKKIVGAMAGYVVDSSVVVYAERQGLLVIGVVAEMIDSINTEGFTPRVY